jgi:hypothetical protein
VSSPDEFPASLRQSLWQYGVPAMHETAWEVFVSRYLPTASALYGFMRAL